jgi:hypothetical protein
MSQSYIGFRYDGLGLVVVEALHLAVVLSAMQVRLQTKFLADNNPFEVI